MAFSTRVATMPHVVAVPECSPKNPDSIGENNRKRLLVALELRHRALACGAREHRIPTRTMPFPLSNRIVLPGVREELVHSSSPAAGRWGEQWPYEDLQSEKGHPTCFPEVLECA
jgi:hypothetical protein